MKFDTDKLQQLLLPLQGRDSFLLGLSGGMDSVVLLHAMSELFSRGLLSGNLRAIHINHGLQDAASRWQSFCEQLCAARQIEFHCASVNINSDGQISGLESKARAERYRVFEGALQAGEVLLLAHHLDDQLETLLFRLNRGSSLKGLAAIPQQRQLGAGEIFRPLLDFTRDELLTFAQAQKLEWVEDGSNEDIQFDRNLLRQEILPAIEARWPGYRSSWQKSLQLITEANSLLEELAKSDLEALQEESSPALSITGLLQLSQARQRNLLCAWVEQQGLPDLGWNQLHHLVNEFIPQAGSEGLLAAEGYEIGKFNKLLYLVKTLAIPVASKNWSPLENEKIELEGSGILKAREVAGQGLSKRFAESVEVRFRQGGESCRLKGRPSKSLKKIMQEAQIEPWWRDRMPLIYRDEELLCIPGIGVCEEAAAGAGEAGLELEWEPARA